MREQLIGTLSHGYRQRVGIAQAIVHRPAFVVLDEPIGGLDPVQIVEMRELVRNLRGEHTVVVSSHILTEISETCDRILVIKDGEIRWSRAPRSELSSRASRRACASSSTVRARTRPARRALGRSCSERRRRAERRSARRRASRATASSPLRVDAPPERARRALSRAGRQAGRSRCSSSRAARAREHVPRAAQRRRREHARRRRPRRADEPRTQPDARRTHEPDRCSSRAASSARTCARRSGCGDHRRGAAGATASCSTSRGLGGDAALGAGAAGVLLRRRAAPRCRRGPALRCACSPKSARRAR